MDTGVIKWNIKKELAAQKKTIKWLAEKTGEKTGHYSRRFRNPSLWTIDEVNQVADALGIEAGELIYGKEGK